MNVEIGRAPAPVSPAAASAEYMVEHITALMTMGGIESISAQRYVSGAGSRLHVSMSPFADAPKEIVDQGVIIKDALAQIMSVANINRLVMNLDDDELARTKEMWTTSVRRSKVASEGSGQDFSVGGSGS